MSQDHLFVQRAIELLGQVIPDVMLHLDGDGILLSSHASERSTRIGLLEPFHGMHIHACTALLSWAEPELTDKLRLTIDTTLQARESGHATFQLRWPSADAPPRHYDMRSLPFSEQTLILIRDTTAEHLLHEQLTISERMSSLGTLAAGVAHEINNPLTYIQCNLVIAIEELEELSKLPELSHLTQRLDTINEVRDSLVVALNGTQRVGRITKDLKHFSRVEQMKAQPLHLLDVLESAMALASNEIRHRALLHKHYEPNLPLSYGDPHQLTQVFVNLLLNAAQSFDAIDVADPVISVTLTGLDDQSVCVKVIDNGEGMNESTLRRIFDPFFTTKGNAGTGLGLSVSHRIVHDLGGTLRAESTRGQGTTMTLTLPCAASLNAPSHLTQLTLDSERAMGATILIIEDEPLIQRLLNRLLDHHELHMFSSIHEALAQLDVISPHVILCDVMLPGESGEHLYTYLMAHAPELVERTLFMTGGAFTPSAELFLSTVQPRLLRKPFKSKELLARVDELLYLS